MGCNNLTEIYNFTYHMKFFAHNFTFVDDDQSVILFLVLDHVLSIAFVSALCE